VKGSAIAPIALFAMRRDRFMLPWWVVGGVLLYWSQAVSVESLYPTQAEFDAAAETMANNPAFIAMAGPARALNTVGGQVTWQASAFGAVVAGLMSMITVGRHTRAEEESGRDELVRAGAVGRFDPLVAVFLVVLLANDDAAREGGPNASVGAEQFVRAASDYFPSRDEELLEYMELLAVFEASSRRLLPKKYATTTPEELDSRLRTLRALVGNRR